MPPPRVTAPTISGTIGMPPVVGRSIVIYTTMPDGPADRVGVLANDEVSHLAGDNGGFDLLRRSRLLLCLSSTISMTGRSHSPLVPGSTKASGQ